MILLIKMTMTNDYDDDTEDDDDDDANDANDDNDDDDDYFDDDVKVIATCICLSLSAYVTLALQVNPQKRLS